MRVIVRSKWGYLLTYRFLYLAITLLVIEALIKGIYNYLMFSRFIYSLKQFAVLGHIENIDYYGKAMSFYWITGLGHWVRTSSMLPQKMWFTCYGLEASSILLVCTGLLTTIILFFKGDLIIE